MESATAPLLIDPSLAVESSEPVADDAPERRSLPRPRPFWVALAVALAAVAGGLVYLKAWPPMATVMSASMSPTIKTGDVVLLKHLDRPPRVRDVIAVDVPDAARHRYGYPPVVIHRVVKIAPNGDVTTKGDAREKPDPFTVKRGSVSSRVVATIPAGGHVIAFFTSTLGLIWLAGGVILLIVIPLFERQRDMRDREEETLSVLRSELRAINDELALIRMRAELPPEPLTPPAPEPEAYTVEMPAVEDMTSAVDEYLYTFESEFARALDDVSREIDSA
jgi:signal peptidase I